MIEYVTQEKSGNMIIHYKSGKVKKCNSLTIPKAVLNFLTPKNVIMIETETSITYIRK